MRNYLCFIFIFWPGVLLFAQIEPVQNSIGELKALKVASVSSYFYPTKNIDGVEAKLILKKEFDAKGNITRKYVLSLWEVVSYSNSSTFTYNKKGQLIEESKVQTILDLGKRDKDFISAFGDTPLNEKTRYSYNEKGQLETKKMYTFSTEELSDTTGPSQSIEYIYAAGLLKVEKSSSANTSIFNQHFEIEYIYDSLENLVMKIKTYGKEMNLKRITDYIYDSENRLVEERIVDAGVPRNSARYKYEYNENGRLINKLVFDTEENDYVVEVSYTYDAHGNIISGEKDIEFSYYENGLIRSELWKDEITDQVFYFVSEYEFH